jgi:hypothetical protein
MPNLPGLRSFVFLLFFAFVSRAENKSFVQRDFFLNSSLSISAGTLNNDPGTVAVKYVKKNGLIFKKRKGKVRGLGGSAPHIAVQTNLSFFNYLPTKPQLYQAEIFSFQRTAQFKRGPPAF